MRNGSAQRRPRAEEAGGRQAQHVLHRHSAGGAGEQMSDAPRGWCDGAGPAQTVAKKAADAFFCSHTFFCSKLSNILLFCKIQARQSFVGCYSRPGVFRDSASQKVSSLRLALVVLPDVARGTPARRSLRPGARPHDSVRAACSRCCSSPSAGPARRSLPSCALYAPCLCTVCNTVRVNLRVQHAVLRLEEHHRLQSVPHLWVQSLRGGGGGEPEASPGG